ncbi:vacuolar protein sorting-associated protein 53, partial [Phenoliferia sp. Uapishka_3]
MVAPPTLSLPPEEIEATRAANAHLPLPELPRELLLSLQQSIDRDALDSFVLGGEQNGGGAQVEDLLNDLIPNEQALAQSPLVALLLRAKIQDLRIEIDDLRRQLEEDQDQDKMEVIQELIGDLLSQVTGIRDAATESEVVVRDITRDIQSLDSAKKNLIASMNALKRFQMLVNAFDQLTRLAKSRRYRETAQALGAVKQLSLYFKGFVNVDRVAAVSRGVQEVQGVLRVQIMREFEAAFANEVSRAGKNAQLQDACLVVDALGEDAKASLLSWYSLLLLRDYRRIFGSSSEAGQLDNISRRFAWFRRVLKTHEDENAIIFPPSWNVGAVLAGGFSEVTGNDLKSVLARSSPSLQVGLLLEALQQTTDFEHELSRKYSMSFESIAALSGISLGRTGPPAAISAVFEPYLGIYVDAQDKTLSEMIQSFVSSRVSLSPSDNPSAVLPSSTELFYFYREALEKCAKLSVRQPLLELCRVYRKWLKVYAEEVLGGLLVKYDRRSQEGRPNIQELQTACLVLNTAEYCHETASQLEERLQEKIHPEYKTSVTLEAEKEIFLSTISSALLSILHELEMTIDGPFSQMARSPWRDAEFVSSESAYVSELTKLVGTVVGVVREGLEQKKYLRSVCDKIVRLVLAKFTQTIVRCRPIAQIGAEQILLDLQFLKSSLMHLPLAPGDSAPVPMTYSRYVSKSVLKVDTLLKVIMTPEEPAEEFIKHYLLLIPCQSFSDFQKVLDLKGVRRAEQNNLLDLFLARTSTATGLSDTSVITGLDMDPGTQSLISPTASGMNSPQPGQHNLGIFNSFTGQNLPMPTGSRDGSRVSTPTGMRDGERGKEALQEFRRFGQRIGMASRLFGGQ